LPEPQGNKKNILQRHKKLVERMLNGHLGSYNLGFAIVRGPVHLWDEESLGNIMRACIIMHNMIVEDERNEYTDEYDCDYNDM